MSSPKDFYDEFDLRLLRDFLSGNPRAEAAISFACEHLKSRRRQSVLDLGCGVGWSTYELSRALPRASVVGVDLSPRLIEISKRMFSSCERIEFVCDDLTHWDWPQNGLKKFDACVMLDVYEHIPKASRSMLHQALSSVLTEDAVLVLSCPSHLHQEFLREHKPEGLQPVDEDVTLVDLLQFASELSGDLSHFEYKSIWATNQYFHATIDRNLSRTKSSEGLARGDRLLTRVERWEYVNTLEGLFDDETMAGLELLGKPSLVRRVMRAFR